MDQHHCKSMPRQRRLHKAKLQLMHQGLPWGHLEGGYLCWTMEVPMVQEKSDQILFVQLKAHQFKFMDLNKMVLTYPLKLIAFFEQCRATNKMAGILEKIAKDKKLPKEKKMAHFPAMHSHESSYQQHPHHKYHGYHWSDRRNCNDRWPDYRHWDNQRHNHPHHDNKDSKSS